MTASRPLGLLQLWFVAVTRGARQWQGYHRKIRGSCRTRRVYVWEGQNAVDLNIESDLYLEQISESHSSKVGMEVKEETINLTYSEEGKPTTGANYHG